MKVTNDIPSNIWVSYMLLVPLLFIESNHIYNEVVHCPWSIAFFVFPTTTLPLPHLEHPSYHLHCQNKTRPFHTHSTPMRQLVDKVLAYLFTCNEVKQATRIDSDEFKSWQSKKHKYFQNCRKTLTRQCGTRLKA